MSCEVRDPRPCPSNMEVAPSDKAPWSARVPEEDQEMLTTMARMSENHPLLLQAMETLRLLLQRYYPK